MFSSVDFTEIPTSSLDLSEKVQLGALILAKNQCRKEAVELQKCITKNDLNIQNKNEVKHTCEQEWTAHVKCIESVPKKDLISGLLNIASANCRKESKEFISCYKKNPSNPENCVTQLHNAMECASDFLIDLVQQTQSQSKTSNGH